MSKTWVTSKKVCERYGGISSMTLWRWERDPRLNFPKPMVVNGRKLYGEPELDEFDAEQRQREAGRLTSSAHEGAMIPGQAQGPRRG
jgi:hypothetical protein